MKLARAIAGIVFLVCAVLAAGIAFIDPYGVSPIRIAVRGLNFFKSERVDIDRILKPYEVWEKQPRTVFLGTSRINQSLDPATLDGTDMAPAYNAAIPASFLAENEKHLELMLKLDKKIKYVVIELYLYNFIFPQNPVRDRSLISAYAEAISLHFGRSALAASFRTIAYNQQVDVPSPNYLSDLGYWIPTSTYNSSHSFSDPSIYIDSILASHRVITDMGVQPSSMAALDRIVALCRANGVTLILAVTPQYPWEDYRLLSLGYWPLMEEWLHRLSAYDNVLSFGQSASFVQEAPGADMRYWHDPIHFNVMFGRAILRALANRPAAGDPANLMRPLTQATAGAIILERSEAIRIWSRSHPEFASAFEGAKARAGGPVDRRP